MESLPEIDVVNSNPSELLASPLNITIQQIVNEDNNSSSNSQDPMETIAIEQVDHVNARSQKRKYPDITADKHFMESGACPPFIKPVKQDEDRDCELVPILSSKQFTFQSQLTSLYMIPTKYKFIIREFKNDYHTSIASKLITPYDWWLNNKVKIFSLQYNFLRPSPYDLRTEENDANFLPYQIKKAHYMTYQKFLQYKEPDNCLFFNSKYTSPFTFSSEYLINHTKTKRKLRNYDPLKQSFLFLQNDNPKRPIIVPQEYLILNDDSLLQEDIPQNISDPLPPFQHIAFQPLGDCEKSYFYAMTKKGYSNNELIFIISHLLSLLTNGNHKEHKKTKQESPKKTKNDIPQPQKFRPTDELQKHTEILNIIKPYHHPNRDILITIAEIVNTLEQARSIIQNIVFDTTRISQSALCIRTSLDEFNYTIEKKHRS